METRIDRPNKRVLFKSEPTMVSGIRVYTREEMTFPEWETFKQDVDRKIASSHRA